MVKEFGDQFEQFTLEFFKRVIESPIVIRDYSFRRAGKTKEGKLRKSPTDLDVLAISNNKIYAITCQEWIPYEEKGKEEEMHRLVDNLSQAIKDIKEKVKTQNQEIIPVIAFLAIKGEDLMSLDNKVKEIIKEKVALLSFLDMLFSFVETWCKPQRTWVPAGNFDWFFSRIVGWFKINSERLKQLISEIPRTHPKYSIISLYDINKIKLEFLYPFKQA
ncbi:MAG: hypothetical protein QXL69_00835 [Candidatus Bathyarchaeia archaeon]|nr:hypothetical protein [Candidatus Bathyarchaeota archaeon]